LKYLQIVGGKSNHLSFAKKAHPNSIEQEEAYLESVASAPNKIMVIVKFKGEIIACGDVVNSLHERFRHTM